MYRLARQALFCLPTETSHNLSLQAIDFAHRAGVLKLMPKPKAQTVEAMGLTFPNPVGLAAGLDKNGDHFEGLSALGFGFVEIGTVTPRPQAGNPQPRLFRLPEYHAIINRMGFNNLGIDHLIAQVRERRFDGILGINIGKNFDTPVDKASDDYQQCMEKAYAHADYIAVNISSPNTPGLRDLQHAEQLDELLSKLKQTQRRLADETGRYVPLALKIAPDLDDEQISDMAYQLVGHEIDGVIAANTTLARHQVARSPLAGEQGGLSGWPVRERATEVVRKLAVELDGALPIIGVGGILDGRDACEKIVAGAALVQVYTGFIYQGPKLIREAVEAISALNQ